MRGTRRKLLNFYLDVETVGLNSPLLTIQYAIGEDEPFVHNIWKEKVGSTLMLMEMMCEYRVVAWHLNFDWFQITKWYNILRHFRDKYGNVIPDPALVVGHEEHRDWCLKPAEAFCQMVHFQLGPGQHLMKRNKPVIIRRVPEAIAAKLAMAIEASCSTRRLPGADIHAYVGQKTQKEGYRDILIKMRGSLGLKHVWGAVTGKTAPWGSSKEVFNHSEFATNFRPWGGQWARMVKYMSNLTPDQIEYAKHDIVMMQDLNKASINGVRCIPDDSPMTEDHVLVPHNAGMRWKGFSIDVDSMLSMHHRLIDETVGTPTSPAAVRSYISAVMEPIEQIILVSTNKHILRELSTWEGEVGYRAKEVIKARHANHVCGAIRKLLEAGGLYPAMKTVGTLTNRSAGGSHVQSSGGSLNPQGMDESLRALLTLKLPGESLSGGDFDGFEPGIACAIWKCPTLAEEMKRGKKIHALFGEVLFQIDYDTIMRDKRLYKKCKIGMLADMYGGTEWTLHRNTGLPVPVVIKRRERWRAKHREVGDFYLDIVRRFSFIDDWKWKQPETSITTVLGFKRKFDLELVVARGIYHLLMRKPRFVENLRGTYERYKKIQSGSTAVGAALWGSLHALQSRIQRVAGNCTIQSTGGMLTKQLQARIWELQPVGVHRWRVRTLNVHDEPVCAHDPEVTDELAEVVEDFIEEKKAIVPLLGMEWRKDVGSWNEVK